MFFMDLLYTARDFLYLTSNNEGGIQSFSELTLAKSFVNTYLTIIKSNTVLEQVAEALKDQYPSLTMKSVRSMLGGTSLFLSVGLLLRVCEEKFDYIILDMTPLNLVTNIAIVAHLVDGYIMVSSLGMIKRCGWTADFSFLKMTSANIICRGHFLKNF